MIKQKNLSETKIQNILEEYLKEKGWKITNEDGIHRHGCDITAWHSVKRKNLFIEIKGGGAHEVQMKHNGFWTLLGQILSRMDIEGNNLKKGRIYAIAIPQEWEKTFTDKIRKMSFGWKLLKLRVFLVDSNFVVTEKSYSKFLKKDLKKKV
jgi:hypothetical protein